MKISNPITDHSQLIGLGTDDHHAGIPSGLIAMFAGLLAAIPTGWVLCDGTNSTPDLRDKFVKGAPDATEPGNTSGAATHLHDAHTDHVIGQPGNHGVTQPSGHGALGTHQHQTGIVKNNGNASFKQNAFGLGSSIQSNLNLTAGGNSVSASTELTQAISGGTPSGHSGTAVTAHGAITADAHTAHSSADSEPAHFEVLYIMKS